MGIERENGRLLSLLRQSGVQDRIWAIAIEFTEAKITSTVGGAGGNSDALRKIVREEFERALEELIIDIRTAGLFKQ